MVRPISDLRVLSGAVRIAGYSVLGIFIAMFIVAEWRVVGPYGKFNITYYEEQADAFLAGQTYLLRTPPPQMLALPDPWDPAANARFREPPQPRPGPFPGVMDLSLYKGRLYLQWGPVPSLLLIPLRWCIGPDVPMGHLVLIIETFAVLAYAASTFLLARLCGIPLGGGIGATLFVQFLICPVWVLVLDRIEIYEAGVCFGQLFMSFALLATVCAFHQRLRQGKSGLWLLVLASVSVGCLVNCRLGLAPFGLILPVIWYCWLRMGHGLVYRRHAVIAALALGLPAACLLLAALVYNEVRFGNFLEVGQTWQLWGGHHSLWQKKFHFIRWVRYLPNIWYYFFSPIELSSGRGLFFVPSAWPPKRWMSQEMLGEYDIYADRMSGLFVVLPVTAVLLLLPVRRFWTALWQGAEQGRLVVAILLLCSVLSAFPLFLAPPTMRYCAEWCMWWLIGGVLVICQLRRYFTARGWRVGIGLLDGVVLLSTFWSGWVGVSFLV